MVQFVKGNVSSVRFFFWNEGKAAIRSHHVLKDLKISFADPAVEILDLKVLRVSRPDIPSRACSSIRRRRVSSSRSGSWSGETE